jgi:hypothetical protein
MTKVLRTIVSSELGDHTCDPAAISQVVRSVAESSQGDVRHAIVQLQLVLSTAAAPRLPSQSLGSKTGAVGKGVSTGAALSQGDIFPRRKRHKPASLPPHNSLEGKSSAAGVANTADPPPIGANAGSTTASDRDACYSSMHCVGRLLHAKLDRCGAVSFDPDSAAVCSELSLSALSDLLQWNAAGCLMDERRIDLDCETRKGDSNSALRELTALEVSLSIGFPRLLSAVSDAVGSICRVSTASFRMKTSWLPGSTTRWGAATSASRRCGNCSEGVGTLQFGYSYFGPAP